jgi:hypothetical protein
LACQDELFVNNLLVVKEDNDHALDFALHFPLGELLPCLMVITVNPTLVTGDNIGQEDIIVGGALTKLLADVDTTAVSDQLSEITSPRLHIEGRKNSEYPPSFVKLCTLTPNIGWYYHLPLHRVSRITVQMAAPVPEIMDIASYL